MDWNMLLEKMPYILAGIGFVLWAAAQFIKSKAESNPKKDFWDKYAPTFHWASDAYSQALDWLCDAGFLKLKGQEKLNKLNELMQDFTKQFEAGNWREAINAVIGFWRDAKGKAVAANPSTDLPEDLKDSPAVKG